MIEISRKAVSEDPGQYWNAFNEVLAMSDTSQLTGLLRQCHLIYWYASEVWNGGHGQYFCNKDYFDHKEVLDALKELGAQEHAKVLEEALDSIEDITNYDLPETKSVEIDCLLDRLDNNLYSVSPELFDFLEAIQKKHEKELVKWVN